MSLKSVVGVVLRTGEKYLPEILGGVGLISMTAGAVVGAKQTPKAVEIMKQNKEELRLIEQVADEAKQNNGIIVRDDKEVAYSEEDHKHDKLISRVNCGKALAKNYLLAAVLYLTGAAGVVGGFLIKNNRLVSAVTAGAALAEGFAAYRGNVIKELGESADKRFRFGEVIEVKTEEKVDEETGEIVKEDKVSTRLGFIPEEDPRVFMFDRENAGTLYTGNLLYDLNVVKVAQRAAQDHLDIYGNVTVNYMREQMGGKDIPEGVDHGIVKDGPGNGRVDFGVFDAEGNPKPWVFECLSNYNGIPIEFMHVGNIKTALRKPRNAR